MAHDANIPKVIQKKPLVPLVSLFIYLFITTAGFIRGPGARP